MSDAVAQALLDIGAVGFAPDAPVTFKSGIVSPVYVDNRRLPYHPAQWHTVIQHFEREVAAHQLDFDVIAGVAVGGVPHSSALAYAMQRPSVFVRKAAKEHGTAQRIEGGDVAGRRVLLIEDLVTTGGSSLSGVTALREAGATVDHVLAIVSYGFAQAAQGFAQASLTLHTLTTFETLLRVAQSRHLFTEAHATIIRDWFDDPHGWITRQSS